MSSEAQIAANRQNAQLSTGPKSDSGKAVSSHNAVKTGLTGRTVLLPTDDRQAFDDHVARLFAQFEPANDAEKSLVHSIAETEWRLLRIPTLESGIYAVGRRKLAEEFSDESDPQVRAAMIEAQIFLTYRKDLSNLALQEARLRRQRQNDRAELEEMQRQRKEQAEAQMKQAIQYLEWSEMRKVELDPAAFGFVFSIEQIQQALDLHRAHLFLKGYEKYAAEYQRTLAHKPKAA